MVLINFILQNNYSVFVIDSDIALFKNPLSIILSHNNYDIVAQQELPNKKTICAGFMYIFFHYYVI